MIFELMDMETGNLLGAWHSEREALRFVHDFVEVNGSDWIGTIALISDDEFGRCAVLAEGEALLRRALDLAA